MILPKRRYTHYMQVNYVIEKPKKKNAEDEENLKKA